MPPSDERRIFDLPAPSLLTTILVAGLFLLSPAANAERDTKELHHHAGHAWHGAEEAFPGRQGQVKKALLLSDDGSVSKEIEYVDYDGEAVVGGDILLHVDDRGFAAFDSRWLDGRPLKSAGRTKDSKQWPGGIVPFTIASGVSSEARGWISEAIAAYEAATSLRFIAQTDEPGYLFFTDSDACSSWIGYQGKMQEINVNGCTTMGSVIHEIGHAIGLYHEHTRRDRNRYVEIVWSNITRSSHNFEPYTHADGVDISDYDFGSIMHYHCWAFTSTSTFNTSTMSIIPEDTSRCYDSYGTFKVGQRKQLSAGDIEGVNQLYPDIQMVAMNSAGRLQGEVLYEVGATDASTQDVGSLTGLSDCITDLDYVPGTSILFALDCEHYGAGGSLMQILDFSAVAAASIKLRDASGDRAATSLAIDPITNELYAIDHAGKGWGDTLLKIDLATSLVTEVGDLWGDHSEASSIAFREDGKLFAIDNSNDHGRGKALFTIDIATAQTREIGLLNGDRTAADTLRFGANSTLYGSRRDNSDGAGSVLFLIDPEDASTRDIGLMSGDRTHATSMAIRNTASPSRDFQMVAMNSSGYSQGNVIYEVDPKAAATVDIDYLGPDATCATDIDFLPDLPQLIGVGCEDHGAGSTLFHYIQGFGVLHVLPIRELTGASRLVTSIAIDRDYNIYAIGHGGEAWGDTLFTIHAGNGVVSDIGPLWGDQTEATSIAFAPNGKTLYGINRVDNQGSGDTLFKINRTTGKTTDIGPLTGSRTRAVTIRFAPDGTLYGTRRHNDDGFGSVLFLIDEDDATTRDVGFFNGDRTHATSMAIWRQ